MSPVLLRWSRVASVPPPPPGAAFPQRTDAMYTHEVQVNWHGTTVTETITALARYPGGTLRRIVRVG